MDTHKIQTLLIFAAILFAVVVGGPFLWDAIKNWFRRREQQKFDEQYQRLQDMNAYDLALIFRKRLQGAVISDGKEKTFTVIKDGSFLRWECDGVKFNWDVFASTTEIFSTTFKMENYEDYVPVKIFLRKTETFKIISVE